MRDKNSPYLTMLDCCSFFKLSTTDLGEQQIRKQLHRTCLSGNTIRAHLYCAKRNHISDNPNLPMQKNTTLGPRSNHFCIILLKQKNPELNNARLLILEPEQIARYIHGLVLSRLVPLDVASTRHPYFIAHLIKKRSLIIKEIRMLCQQICLKKMPSQVSEERISCTNLTFSFSSFL